MKKLILRYFKPMDDKVYFTIEEQSHREREFGNRSNTFRGSRGIVLGSASYPAISYNCDKLYCRGNVIGSDYKKIKTTLPLWNKIKEAVKEYNEYFGNFDECILGDPDEIIGDIVPKEMFMVD